MAKIHFGKFIGHRCLDTLGGPDVVEEYAPLCGVRADDPEMDCGQYGKSLRRVVNCLRCLKMLEPPTNTRGDDV